MNMRFVVCTCLTAVKLAPGNTAEKRMRMRQFPHFRFARVVWLFRLILLFVCGV